jgi:exportin-2 (importin alpha re-exporter)
VFQKLVSSRAQDHHGFFILNAFVEALPLPAWADKLPAIWGILFQRLQSSKTTKFSKCFVVFISLLAAKHGVVAVTESMAKVQPGIFEMVLTGVVTEAIANISGTGGGEGCRRRGGQVSDGVPRGAGAGHRLGQAC